MGSREQRDAAARVPNWSGSRKGRSSGASAARARAEEAPGDNRSVKIETPGAAKIMKTEWLVLGCVEANFRN